MCEDVKKIARKQITAESEVFCSTDETSNTLRLNLCIVCVPLKEAEDGISLQGIQDKEC